MHQIGCSPCCAQVSAEVLISCSQWQDMEWQALTCISAPAAALVAHPLRAVVPGARVSLLGSAHRLASASRAASQPAPHLARLGEMQACLPGCAAAWLSLMRGS